MVRRIFSERRELILKSREAALSAVQIYDNPFKEYWVKEDREKPKFLRKGVLMLVKEAGFTGFGPAEHTNLWKEHDAKNPSKGYGWPVCGTWYWYQKWVDFVIEQLNRNTGET